MSGFGATYREQNLMPLATAPPEHCPGTRYEGSTRQEGPQAYRGPGRNAAPDRGKEGQGNCDQACGKAGFAAEKSRIEV